MAEIITRLAKAGTTTGISLPVRIFEPRSVVEKLSDFWTFAPIFLNHAAKLNDPVERMKNVIAFWVSGLHMGQTV